MEEWHPVCVFGEEPDWDRLGKLSPRADIIGYVHRSSRLWFLDGGIDDMPQDYRFLFPLGWPVDFTTPEGVSLPATFVEFMEKAGAAGLAAHAVHPGELRYGTAVAALAGVRTFVYPGTGYPASNMAFVLNNGTVKAFGAACGSSELWWEDGTIAARWLTGAESPDTDLDRECFEGLKAVPFVCIDRVQELSNPGPRDWPQCVWPEAWGDSGEDMGIGRAGSSIEWLRNWKPCYYRPSCNHPGALAEMFEIAFGRPFANTWLGNCLGVGRDREYGDED